MLTYKGREIPETFAEIVDPKHTALIVHEMLNDFLNPNGEFAKTIPDNGLVKCLPDQIGPLVEPRQGGPVRGSQGHIRRLDELPRQQHPR